ncbi:MAG: hypothetical protein QF692_00375 [Alphaproteobacteria bacterium]|jgi:hypothetical protein|nr:hypothetical protein [Alphaproteobacteria bacterium]MDP7221702.1 hypothetical protein [Alphaproteobacteria bacterium]
MTSSHQHTSPQQTLPQIDIYCERVFAGLFDEPLNLLSNLAFMIAAVLLFVMARRHNISAPAPYVLIVLIFIIGIGSALFHSFATVWSKFADVIPILIFQLAFIVTYARNIMGRGPFCIIGFLVLFTGLSVGTGTLPYDWLNGSLGYAPALFFVLGFGVDHWRKHRTEPFVLLLAAVIFVVSLTFRSIDMTVCAALPVGVHYMWHILNAAVLYLSVRAVLVNMK